MNKMNEKLRNKKKLLVLALATTMGLIPVTGCSDNFEYTIESDGNINVEGLISHDKVKNLKLIHLTNELAEIDKYFLVSEHYIKHKYALDKHYYKDIETGEIVFNFNHLEEYKNFKLEIILDTMVDYLYKYDMIKEEYSIEDIIKLKESLLSEEKLITPTEESSLNVLKRKKVK